MPYQVLARKWRPRRFDEVVGQRAVTETLKNAILAGRLAQSFVFAGPRGVGKTTTARILSRALNCVKGPTAEPCGECEACLEIAEGRDMDVLEIDAATHTQVDNVREVIVEGLAIPPIRDRYKIFIIDEVHQLSNHSFNALLKSIEEPPPRVAFIMATTELRKVPETIRSRSQVFEFRTISSGAIAGQLKAIAAAEGLTITDEALALITRAADGSMRDAETALDQVISFAGTTIDAVAVQTVLGLVGRELLLEVLEAVADENAAAAFDLPARAAEAGHDFRTMCRELARLVRDLMVVAIDKERINDPDTAAEGERDRIRALSERFSREDLLRAFDLLARAEADIRGGGEPRYHFEMTLLRLMHARKLVPFERVIEGLGGASPGTGGAGPSGRGRSAGGGAATTRDEASTPVAPSRSSPAASPVSSSRFDQLRSSIARQQEKSSLSDAPPRRAERPATRSQQASPSRGHQASGRREEAATERRDADDSTSPLTREAFLAEVKTKPVFLRMVLAQAERVDVTPEGIVFAFSAGQRGICDLLEENRTWLESVARRLAGRPVPISSVLAPGNGENGDAGPGEDSRPGAANRHEVKAAAMADPTVRALAEVFPVEIREIEDNQDRQ